MEPVSENTPLDRFPGKTLDGFVIETPLGRGGMAAVFRARDLALNRPVALKVLRSQAVRDGATRERFLDEARAAAKLHHPNVVETYRAGEMSGVLYMAMQYVNGRTLEKLLKNEGRMPWRRALAVGREVARALEAAHAAGMAHRDIKPANIMVGPDGHATVMDFGVAKPLAGEVMDSREFAGTPVYASPEQHSTGPVDGRTDLWSLGVTLYQMLTGRIPFVAEDPADLRHKIATEEPIALRDLEPSVPVPVAALVAKLMSKHAADRPATAGDAIRAMDTALRKATLKWPLVAAAAVLLIAGGAIASQRIRAWRPAESNPEIRTVVHGTTASGPAPAPADVTPAKPPMPSAPWTACPHLLVAELTGPEGDWLRTAVPDLVSRDVAAGGRVVVLKKSRACADIALAPDVEAAAESAGRTHGAEAVLCGDVSVNGERVQVHLVLLRLKSGTEVKRQEFTVTGSRREVNVLAASLAEKVRKVLEAPPKKEEGS